MLPEINFKVIVFLVSLAGLATGAVLLATARGQRGAYDFCAVDLSVTGYYGNPLPSGVADLIDPSGKVVQTRKIADGRARFCDFGFGEHSIFVYDGLSRCEATEIRNVHVMYGVRQKLRVVLNHCVDEGDVGPGACGPEPCADHACLAYIRVISPDGHPLKACQIKDRATGHSEYTDSYGRAGVLVWNGRPRGFALAKPGYRDQHLTLTCSPSLNEIQRLVTLQPNGAGADRRR